MDTTIVIIKYDQNIIFVLNTSKPLHKNLAADALLADGQDLIEGPKG
jgi:hypothetical protein